MEETDGEVTHNRTKKTEYIKPEQMTTEKVRLNSVEEAVSYTHLTLPTKLEV